jgi:hypothetical protein
MIPNVSIFLVMRKLTTIYRPSMEYRSHRCPMSDVFRPPTIDGRCSETLLSTSDSLFALTLVATGDGENFFRDLREMRGRRGRRHNSTAAPRKSPDETCTALQDLHWELSLSLSELSLLRSWPLLGPQSSLKETLIVRNQNKFPAS